MVVAHLITNSEQSAPTSTFVADELALQVSAAVRAMAGMRGGKGDTLVNIAESRKFAEILPRPDERESQKKDEIIYVEDIHFWRLKPADRANVIEMLKRGPFMQRNTLLN